MNLSVTSSVLISETDFKSNETKEVRIWMILMNYWRQKEYMPSVM